MTIEEKRDLLEDYCCDFKDECEECPLGSNSICHIKTFNTFTDDEIEYAYKVIFGAKKEEINHPDRYAGDKFECIDVMLDVFGADAVKHFCILNAFKYLWRSEKKNGVEDIKKAVWYLNKYIELGGEGNKT